MHDAFLLEVLEDFGDVSHDISDSFRLNGVFLALKQELAERLTFLQLRD